MLTFFSKENNSLDMMMNEICHQFSHDFSSHLFLKAYIFLINMVSHGKEKNLSSSSTRFKKKIFSTNTIKKRINEE